MLAMSLEPHLLLGHVTNIASILLLCVSLFFVCPSLSPQSQEIDVLIGKDRETFYTSGLTLGSKKCSVLRDSLQDEGDWTMDIRTKSQGGEPTYNISVGRAGKGKGVLWVSFLQLSECIFRLRHYCFP